MHDLANHLAVSSDISVIEKIINGEQAMFEILIRRYNPVLYRIARSYSFNHQDAQDLMQDTHIAAYLELKSFENRASYKTWISRIMINKCLYKLKYGYNKNEFPSEIVSEANVHPMHTKNKDGQTEDAVLNKELSIILEKSLQHIPLHYRSVFVLREVEGFTVAETAALLQITPVNVKVRLNRAKALLQKEIESIYAHADLYPFNLVYCDKIVERSFEAIKKLGG